MAFSIRTATPERISIVNDDGDSFEFVIQDRQELILDREPLWSREWAEPQRLVLIRNARQVARHTAAVKDWID